VFEDGAYFKIKITFPFQRRPQFALSLRSTSWIMSSPPLAVRPRKRRIPALNVGSLKSRRSMTNGPVSCPSKS
jgi:hypothetical protein